MDAQAFQRACMDLEREGRAGAGIGTLGEKTLHSLLKRAIEPDVSCHEVPVGRYVADVRNERGFFEVQTRDLYRLSKKVEAFLQEAPVQVVYPIMRTTELIYLDPETGTLSEKRKSPKKGSFYKALADLYDLRSLFFRPGFSIEIVLLDGEEIRLLDGYGGDKKKHATRYERIPTAFIDSCLLEKPEDFWTFFPQNELEAPFDIKTLGKVMGLKQRENYRAAAALRTAGVLEVVGKRGRSLLLAPAEEKSPGK